MSELIPGRRMMWPVLALAVVLHFQNCARQSDSAELPSTVPVVEVPHEDSDQTIPGEGKARLETTYEPLLADRLYISSLLAEVFGPEAEKTDSTRIGRDAPNQGAPCSVYEDYNADVTADGKPVRADADQSCGLNSVNRISARVNPAGTVTRQALLARACSDLVNTPATLTYALSRISTDAVPAASADNVLKAFRLFYRNHPDPQTGLIESLQLMMTPSAPTAEEWARVLYTICASSHWQVL